jgi:hypothetical protein
VDNDRGASPDRTLFLCNLFLTLLRTKVTITTITEETLPIGAALLLR